MMHFNTFTAMSDQEYDRLKSVLDNSQNGKFWLCQMPEGFSPQQVRVAMAHRGDSYAIRTMESAVYHGNNKALRKLTQGIQSFSSFAKLKAYLKSAHVAEATDQSTQPSAPVSQTKEHPETRTDLDQISVKDDKPTVQYVDPEGLLERCAQQIRGQEEALPPLCRQVAAHVAKINPDRPLTLLISGPAGCGKSYTAKTMAEAINDMNPACHYGTIMVHCNELSESNHVHKLLGAPAGYVGYGDELVLGPVATKPFQIVVFDEVEKAHSAVLKTIMTAMDCGYMMLNKAPEGGSLKLDLRRCIFFFTSNLPLDQNMDPSLDIMGRDQHYRKALRAAGILPEIVDRFYFITTYRPLNGRAMAEIVTKGIGRVAAQYGITLTYVCPTIVQSLYDLSSGATSARIIETLVDRHLGVFFAMEAQNERNQLGFCTCELVGSLDDPRLVIQMPTQPLLKQSQPPEPAAPEPQAPMEQPVEEGAPQADDVSVQPAPETQDPPSPAPVTPPSDTTPPSDEYNPNTFWKRFL